MFIHIFFVLIIYYFWLILKLLLIKKHFFFCSKVIFLIGSSDLVTVLCNRLWLPLEKKYHTGTGRISVSTQQCQVSLSMTYVLLVPWVLLCSWPWPPWERTRPNKNLLWINIYSSYIADMSHIERPGSHKEFPTAMFNQRLLDLKKMHVWILSAAGWKCFLLYSVTLMLNYQRQETHFTIKAWFVLQKMSEW